MSEFRPRLPKDPFADAAWLLDVASLPSKPPAATTVLILNTPPPDDLAALLHASPTLAHSLVLIATHDVPVLPPVVLPTVRVLRLLTSLCNSGALGVMSVLDKAARIAMSASPSHPGDVQIYTEDPVSGEFTVQENPSPSLPPPPTEKKKKRMTLNFGFGASPTHTASSLPTLPSALSTIPTGTRPFDTLIHYLPSPSSALSEKILLKQAILVTTLSAPYLNVPPEPPGHLRMPTTPSRRSIKEAVAMGASKSMPRLDSSSPSDPTTLSIKCSATTAPLYQEQADEELGFSPSFASKSTTSFRSFKRRFTIGGKGKNDGEGGSRNALTDKRLSTLPSRSGTRQETPTEVEPPPPIQRYTGRSHIIHIVEDAANTPINTTKLATRGLPSQLAKNIEQFLIAFSYQSHLRVSPAGSPTADSRSSSRSANEPRSVQPKPSSTSRSSSHNATPIPFVLRRGAFGGVVSMHRILEKGKGPEAEEGAASASVAECIMFGCLDGGFNSCGGGVEKAWLDVDDRGVICAAGGSNCEVVVVVHAEAEIGGTTGPQQQGEDKKTRRRSNNRLPLSDMSNTSTRISPLAPVPRLAKVAVGVYGGVAVNRNHMGSPPLVPSLRTPTPPLPPLPAKPIDTDSASPTETVESRGNRNPVFIAPIPVILEDALEATLPLASPTSNRTLPPLPPPPSAPITVAVTPQSISPSSSPSPIPHHNHHHASREMETTPPKNDDIKREEEVGKWEEGKTGLLTPPESSVSSGSDCSMSGEEARRKGKGVGGVGGLVGGRLGAASDFVQAHMYERPRRPLPVPPAAPALEKRKEDEGGGNDDDGSRRKQEVSSVTLEEENTPGAITNSIAVSPSSAEDRCHQGNYYHEAAVSLAPVMGASRSVVMSSALKTNINFKNKEADTEYNARKKAPERYIIANNTSDGKERTRGALIANTNTSSATQLRSQTMGMGKREVQGYANALKRDIPSERDHGHALVRAPTGSSQASAEVGSTASAVEVGDIRSTTGVPPVPNGYGDDTRRRMRRREKSPLGASLVYGEAPQKHVYHYKKPAWMTTSANRGGGQDLDAATNKKRNSSNRIGDFVGKVFSGTSRSF